MKKNQNKKNAICALNRIFVATAIFILSAASVWANAFRLPNQDPEAIARGDAFTATADDPSAIYYNPAGITQLPGEQISIGAYIISADSKFSSPSGNAKTDTTPQPVPQLYATYTLTNLPLSFGLGVYAPYGLSVNWGNNTPFNSIAEKGSLEYVCVNPVAAWKVSKTLSVAIGPNFNFSQVGLQNALFFSPGNRFNFTGEGWDIGYNAGILWQPDPMWSFGLNYRSGTEITYRGRAGQNFGPPFATSVNSSATLHFPKYVTGGISFRPTANWNFEFDLDWSQWDVDKSATFSATPFGPQTLTFNFQDSFIFEFGATRQLWNGYFASVGYMYSENSCPSTTYNPLIDDADLSLGGVGFGHHGKRIDWMAAFQFAYAQRNVSGGQPSLSGQTANGKYTVFNKALNISATYKF
ncbi:MAG TPA: outer membrane protein transport protein [Verrucomicrobiae bacterium]|jgi:long-chain fatty acid transport protein